LGEMPLVAIASLKKFQRKAWPIHWARFSCRNCQNGEEFPTCLSVPHSWTNRLAWLKGSVCS